MLPSSFLLAVRRQCLVLQMSQISLEFLFLRLPSIDNSDENRTNRMCLIDPIFGFSENHSFSSTMSI